jgi:hypothetical protein
MQRMCAVGSSQETSIAAATPAGIGGSMREAGGGTAPGARRVAGGRSRNTLLTGGNASTGGGSLLTGGGQFEAPYGRPQYTMER